MTQQTTNPAHAHQQHGTPVSTEHEHPQYTYNMRELLQELWTGPEETRKALRLRLATDPTTLFKERNIIRQLAEIKIVIVFDQPGVFHVPIPEEPTKPDGKDEDKLLTLASHLIRCCADGC